MTLIIIAQSSFTDGLQQTCQKHIGNHSHNANSNYVSKSSGLYYMQVPEKYIISVIFDGIRLA
jgi:hypothetical protein